MVERNPAYAIIETGGIGYKLHITLNCYERLAGQDECSLLAQLIIKEDAHELYGFIDREEKDLFLLLRSVTKIGPNIARMILSSFKTEELKKAILNNDSSLISSVKGIGNKTAQRIVVELQDTISKEDHLAREEVSSGTSQLGMQQEATTALVALGFNKSSADKVVGQLIADQGSSVSVESIVKEALKRL